MQTTSEEIVLPKRRWRTDIKNGSILFVGTATTIIRFGGFTILTDPNFLHRGDHVHLGYGLRSKRLTDPSMEIEDLPTLDLALLSHMHEDHFDRVAAEKLDRTIPIVTTPHAASDLSDLGFQSPIALGTWDTQVFRKGNVRLHVTAMPGRHGGPIISRALPPVMGSMLEFRSARDVMLLRLYISGDTLTFKALAEIPRRYPDIDIALLHLGGTRVLGVLVTMDDKQGVKAVKLLQPQIVIPIHYNDYGVFKSPVEDFLTSMEAEGMGNRVRYLEHGESYSWRVPKSRLRGGDESTAS